MTSALDLILAPGGLSVLFQPIVKILAGRRSLHSLECLIRGPKGTNMEPANVLFEYVRRKAQECLVDRACMRAALRAARELPSSIPLALNVHAATLVRDPEFLSFLCDVAGAESIALSRLTLEIVEHAPAWDLPLLREVRDALRHIGVRVALDDVGLGHSNLKMIIDCSPDYFKIDRYLVYGIAADYRRRVVVDSVCRLAREFGGRAIAEGVEEPADLDTLTALGIELVQGHLLFPALTLEAAGPVLDALLQGSPSETRGSARPGIEGCS